MSTYEKWKLQTEETIKQAEYIKSLMRKPYNVRTAAEEQELKKWYEGVKTC